MGGPWLCFVYMNEFPIAGNPCQRLDFIRNRASSIVEGSCFRQCSRPILISCFESIGIRVVCFRRRLGVDCGRQIW